MLEYILSNRNQIIVGTGLFGCLYTLSIYLKRRFHNKNSQTLDQLLAEIKTLHYEMCLLLNKVGMDDALKHQLHKSAWHTLNLEGESTGDDSIDTVIAASKYAADVLKFGMITERHIRTIHGKLTCSEFHAGNYRQDEVKVTALPDSKHGDYYPPSFRDVQELMLNFVAWLNNQRCTDPLEVLKVATEAKARFLYIHPFLDGNGRASRAIFNGLMRQANYPWIVVPSENKYEYLFALECYVHEKKKAPIRRFMAQCLRNSILEVIEEWKRS